MCVFKLVYIGLRIATHNADAGARRDKGSTYIHQLKKRIYVGGDLKGSGQGDGGQFTTSRKHSAKRCYPLSGGRAGSADTMVPTSPVKLGKLIHTRSGT
jgi:hypothetical protein